MPIESATRNADRCARVTRARKSQCILPQQKWGPRGHPQRLGHKRQGNRTRRPEGNLAITALNEMSLVELDELAAKLRHAIARKSREIPGRAGLRMLSQWIAIRPDREDLKSES